MNKIYLFAIGLIALSAQAYEYECTPSIQAFTPETQFVINNDNTVTDKNTGLTWMRCSLGQTGSDCSGGKAKRFSWSGAVLKEIATNYRGWRLPTATELISIIEYRCQYPAVNIFVFPNTESGGYLSSSAYTKTNRSKKVWTVSFQKGRLYANDGRNIYARLVRDSE